MKRTLVVRMNELPPRPEALSPEALSNVFGGCSNDTCWSFRDSECCKRDCWVMFFVPVCY